MRMSRSLLALIASALLLLAACGSTDNGSGGSEVDVADASSATTANVDPEPDDPTDPDEPVAVPVPTLPIGGQSHELDGVPGVVCAEVGWLWPDGSNPSVPEGISVRVTDYVIDPEVFEPTDASCGGASCLDGFVFTAGSTACQVALLSLVPWTDEQQGEDAVLRLAGEMTCPAEPCELENVEGGDTEVTLEAPEVGTEPSEPSESIESTDPTEPTESVESTDATDSTETG
jgi:hypothetical protein